MDDLDALARAHRANPLDPEARDAYARALLRRGQEEALRRHWRTGWRCQEDLCGMDGPDAGPRQCGACGEPVSIAERPIEGEPPRRVAMPHPLIPELKEALLERLRRGPPLAPPLCVIPTWRWGGYRLQRRERALRGRCVVTLSVEGPLPGETRSDDPAPMVALAEGCDILILDLRRLRQGDDAVPLLQALEASAPELRTILPEPIGGVLALLGGALTPPSTGLTEAEVLCDLLSPEA